MYIVMINVMHCGEEFRLLSIKRMREKRRERETEREGGKKGWSQKKIYVGNKRVPVISRMCAGVFEFYQYNRCAQLNIASVYVVVVALVDGARCLDFIHYIFFRIPVNAQIHSLFTPMLEVYYTVYPRRSEKKSHSSIHFMTGSLIYGWKQVITVLHARNEGGGQFCSSKTIVIFSFLWSISFLKLKNILHSS